LLRAAEGIGVIDPAGYGTFAWTDTRVLFGWFGPHTAELAPLYAGALTPALVGFLAASVAFVIVLTARRGAPPVDSRR
jgi:hypothetical protein